MPPRRIIGDQQGGQDHAEAAAENEGPDIRQHHPECRHEITSYQVLNVRLNVALHETGVLFETFVKADDLTILRRSLLKLSLVAAQLNGDALKFRAALLLSKYPLFPRKTPLNELIVILLT